jgi:sugar/nucleoside kinase (ribokinase family)
MEKMMSETIDVLAFGNAIVDVIAHTQDDFLVQNGLAKGTMRLIDEAEAERLYARMGPAQISSGGSAANTIAGLASLGGKGAFIGKVKEDARGKHFAHDIRAQGVRFMTLPAIDGAATACSYILVTPDGERTMNTYLGACQHLTSADVDETLVKNAKIVYLEGYLWDPLAAKDAFRKAAHLAHSAGGKVAFTLSDPFCVDRYRSEFLELIRTGVIDILFANEHELRSLYTSEDTQSAIEQLLSEKTNADFTAVITRSAHGAIWIKGGQHVSEPACVVDSVVDTTGAGDLFAAGVLYGLTHEHDPRSCLRLGALAAAEVISHIGARPARSLRDLALENGLLIAA